MYIMMCASCSLAGPQVHFIMMRVHTVAPPPSPCTAAAHGWLTGRLLVCLFQVALVAISKVLQGVGLPPGSRIRTVLGFTRSQDAVPRGGGCALSDGVCICDDRTRVRP